MNNNDDNTKKGNGSEKREINDITPTDIFGSSSIVDEDVVISSSGDYVIWEEDHDTIYIERRDGKRISRRLFNGLRNPEDPSVVRNAFRQGNKIKIDMGVWIIDERSHKPNVVGEAEDLIPIIAEAI